MEGYNLRPRSRSTLATSNVAQAVLCVEEDINESEITLSEAMELVATPEVIEDSFARRRLVEEASSDDVLSQLVDVDDGKGQSRSPVDDSRCLSATAQSGFDSVDITEGIESG